jgi:hypothetical protein
MCTILVSRFLITNQHTFFIRLTSSFRDCLIILLDLKCKSDALGCLEFEEPCFLQRSHKSNFMILYWFATFSTFFKASVAVQTRNLKFWNLVAGQRSTKKCLAMLWHSSVLLSKWPKQIPKSVFFSRNFFFLSQQKNSFYFDKTIFGILSSGLAWGRKMSMNSLLHNTAVCELSTRFQPTEISSRVTR